jgi:hypothetical protein
MAFGQDFLNGFFGNEYVRDYSHASKIFTSNGYENAPRFKFLFHVYFNLNTAIPGLANVFDAGTTSTIGLLVKNIDLPKYKIDTEVLNQYNRKRIVQKKIEYQPVSVKFHDDGGDLSRNLWYNYYSYYYKDPSQKYGNVPNTNGTLGLSATQSNAFNYNNRGIYAGDQTVNDWGYIGENYYDASNSQDGKPAFFRDITIYGFNQHKWVSYVLINPMISDWSHDQYYYNQPAGVMENSMTIQYETVKYYGGGIGGVRPDTNVQGFGDLNYYDQIKSPLSKPGGTRSILGQGGLVDTGIGIISDLSANNLAGVLGAVQKSGAAYQTFRNQNLSQIARAEAVGAVNDVLRATQQGTAGGIPTTGISNALKKPLFPTPPKR